MTICRTTNVSLLISRRSCDLRADNLLRRQVCVCLCVQTVLNTMCGYGMQQLEPRSAGQDVFTVGCLEKIVWWAKNNMQLVAGLTGGLLFLEVSAPFNVLFTRLDASWPTGSQTIISLLFPLDVHGWIQTNNVSSATGLSDLFGRRSDLQDQ